MVNLLITVVCLLLVICKYVSKHTEECFSPICGMKTACTIAYQLHCFVPSSPLTALYLSTSLIKDFVKPLMETHFFFAGSESAIECIYITGIAEAFCGAQDGHRRLVTVPRTIAGVVNVSHYAKDMQFLNTQRYFVVLVDSIPAVSSVDIQYPPFGTIIPVDLFTIRYSATSGTTGGDESINLIDFAVTGVMELPVASNTNIIQTSSDASAVEPGSWFVRMTPKHLDGRMGYTTAGYIEYVLNNTEMQKHRRITTRTEKEKKIAALMKQKARETKQVHLDGSTLPTTHPLHVCIWGSNHMDGQKNIWMQQIARMDRTLFSFTWIMTTTEHVPEGIGLAERLAQIQGVRILQSPLATEPLKIVSEYSFTSGYMYLRLLIVLMMLRVSSTRCQTMALRRSLLPGRETREVS